MTLVELRELCEEFGAPYMGDDERRLVAWLRGQLEAADGAEDACEDCGAHCGCDFECNECAELQGQLEAAENELRELKREQGKPTGEARTGFPGVEQIDQRQR